jgi:hypothetical protein
MREAEYENRPHFVVRSKHATWWYDRAGGGFSRLVDRIGDRDVPRVLYLAQHKPDELFDTLWYIGGTRGGSADAPEGMVVVGFGRGPGATPLLEGARQRFTVGLLDQPAQSDHASNQRAIERVLSHQSQSALVPPEVPGTKC